MWSSDLKMFFDLEDGSWHGSRTRSTPPESTSFQSDSTSPSPPFQIDVSSRQASVNPDNPQHSESLRQDILSSPRHVQQDILTGSTSFWTNIPSKSVSFQSDISRSSVPLKQDTRIPSRLIPSKPDFPSRPASFRTGDLSRSTSFQTDDLSRSTSFQTGYLSRPVSLQTGDLSRSTSFQTDDLSRSTSFQTGYLSRPVSLQTGDLSRSTSFQTGDLSRSTSFQPMPERNVTRPSSTRPPSGSRLLLATSTASSSVEGKYDSVPLKPETRIRSRLIPSKPDLPSRPASFQTGDLSRPSSFQTGDLSRSASFQTCDLSRSTSFQTCDLSRPSSFQTGDLSRPSSFQTGDLSRSTSFQTGDLSRPTSRSVKPAFPSRQSASPGLSATVHHSPEGLTSFQRDVLPGSMPFWTNIPSKSVSFQSDVSPSSVPLKPETRMPSRLIPSKPDLPSPQTSFQTGDLSRPASFHTGDLSRSTSIQPMPERNVTRPSSARPRQLLVTSTASSSVEGGTASFDKLCEIMALKADRTFPAPGLHQNVSCNLCKRNGEEPRFYRTHALSDSAGRVTCPILRQYVCPLCGATGDDAHTISYCPLSREESAVATSRTPRKSCGCVRMCRHGRYRRH